MRKTFHAMLLAPVEMWVRQKGCSARARKRAAPRASTGGIEMTRTELSAEPETTRSAEGLNRSEVTGKSCALRIVRIDCKTDQTPVRK